MTNITPTEAELEVAGAVVHEYGPDLGHYPDLKFSIAIEIATARMEGVKAENERCAVKCDELKIAANKRLSQITEPVGSIEHAIIEATFEGALETSKSLAQAIRKDQP